MKKTDSLSKSGFWISFSTFIFTVLTFLTALFTPPISGPFASDPLKYPFENIISRFPKDYIWMFTAMILMILFILFSLFIFYSSEEKKKIYAHAGLIFSVISSLILLTDYYIQISFIQVSLLNSETQAIAALTQYNPHGIFIILEEIGYIMMSLAFLFFIPVFSEKNKSDGIIRKILLSDVIINIISFIIITLFFGIKREYIFEVVIISVNFIFLAVFSLLVSLRVRKNG
ncbi:MAG TPA: hypothetical protein PLS66_11740 [Tepiditoga sp.]|nr:hypothetical protein [Thermotogota bacterium]HOO75956.1 hypothetical protein [Tepiditoga sp.]